jgi:hypothetical protein
LRREISELRQKQHGHGLTFVISLKLFDKSAERHDSGPGDKKEDDKNKQDRVELAAAIR